VRGAAGREHCHLKELSTRSRKGVTQRGKSYKNAVLGAQRRPDRAKREVKAGGKLRYDLSAVPKEPEKTKLGEEKGEPGGGGRRVGEGKRPSFLSGTRA